MSVGYIGQYVGMLYDFLYMLYDFIWGGGRERPMLLPITCTLTLRWLPLSLGEYQPSHWPGAPYVAAYNVYFNSAMAAPVVGRVPAVTLAGSALWYCL